MMSRPRRVALRLSGPWHFYEDDVRMTESLLPLVAAGDRIAIESCIARYGGLVWSLARKQSPTPTDAEDAVQEIFMDVWRSAGRFDAAVASETTFVAMIARRRLIDRKRKARITIETCPLSAQHEPTEPIVDRAMWSEEADLARAKLEELRPEERNVIRLAVDQGMTHAEIAATLEMPLGTVKSFARRGLQRLREALEKRSRKDFARGTV